MRPNLYFLLALCPLSLTGGAVAQERVMTLSEMFATAEENNLTIEAAQSSISEAEAGISYAKSDRLPDIDFSISLSVIGNAWISDRDFSNGMNAETPHFGNTYSVAITQMLYAGGAIKNGIEMAELRRDIATIGLDATRQAMRLVIAGYYMDLCKLQNQKTILEKNMVQTRKLVEDIEANYAAGTALKSDITRYELQLQSLELSLTQVRTAMDITSRNLTVALGMPTGTAIAPDTTIVGTAIEIGSEDDWQKLVEARPQVAIAKKQYEMVQKSESISKAGMRPTVALRVEDKLDGPITYEVPVLDKNVNFWYAGVNISYNLGSLYKTRRKVTESQRATATSQVRLADEVSYSQAAIHAAYQKYQEALTDKATHEKSVQLAHENYDVIHYRYLNGMALITDMLDASNQQLNSELQLANSEIDIIYCHMILKATVGQL